MSFQSFYSKKLKNRIESPKFVGCIHEKSAQNKKMRLVIGKEENLQRVHLYWLVDEIDGVISDTKFQVFGASALIGAADIASELVLRKNYDQASRIGADLLDSQLRDKKDTPAFPEECNVYLNMVISAIDDAAQKCLDLPIKETYTETPISYEPSAESYPDFEGLSSKNKLVLIEEIVDKEIRPFIELDAGGIQIHGLNGFEVIISYEGSCTSCYAATGSTLSAIQNILKSRVHSELFVTPLL